MEHVKLYNSRFSDFFGGEFYFTNLRESYIILNGKYHFWYEKSIIQWFFHIFRVPFNWRTPIGYLVYVVFYIATGLSLTLSATATLSFCIGSFLLLISFVEDATNDLARLNVDEKSKSYDIDVKIHFHTAVHAYSDLQELSEIVFLVHFILVKRFFL